MGQHHFVVLILLCLKIVEHSFQNCTRVEKNIFNIHGAVLKISVPIEVTLCHPGMVVQGMPIILTNYTEYFKFKAKHPRMRMQGDKLQHLYSNTFIHLSNIKTLIISQLEMEDIEQKAFKGLYHLRYLNLDDNKLTRLPENIFDDVPDLVELNVNDNQLEILEAGQFRELRNLKTLRLAANKLKDLPSGLFINQKQLKYLTFTKNLFSSLRDDLFEGLEELTELKLLMNELGLIEENAFRGLLQLEHLALEYNQIIIFFDVTRTLGNIPNLKRLSASPENFLCETYYQVLESANKTRTEVVELSGSNQSCIQSPTISKFS